MDTCNRWLVFFWLGPQYTKRSCVFVNWALDMTNSATFFLLATVTSLKTWSSNKQSCMAPNSNSECSLHYAPTDPPTSPSPAHWKKKLGPW